MLHPQSCDVREGHLMVHPPSCHVREGHLVPTPLECHVREKHFVLSQRIPRRPKGHLKVLPREEH